MQALQYNSETNTLKLQIEFATVHEAEAFPAAFNDPAWSARLVGTEDAKGRGLARFEFEARRAL